MRREETGHPPAREALEREERTRAGSLTQLIDDAEVALQPALIEEVAR
jgi:hypothetical protein